MTRPDGSSHIQQSDLPAYPEPVEGEPPWTDYVDTLVRWRRFVVLGIIISSVGIGAVAFFWPKSYDCEATLTFFSVTTPPSKERPATVGVSLATYKKIERMLGDQAVLAATFNGVLTDSGIDSLAHALTSHVLPVSTGPRDEIARLDKDDTITGVRLVFADRSEAKALGVVESLAGLVRESLVTTSAQDMIASQMLGSTTSAAEAQQQAMTLRFTNGSLGLLRDQLKRLVPGATGLGGSREVVDVAQGGHRYLPPGLQVVGVDSQVDENEHTIRLAERTYRIETLRLKFLRQLDEKLRSRRTLLAAPVPSLFAQELQAFLKSVSASEAEFLRADLGAQREALAAQHYGTHFVQYPTFRRRSRVVPVIAALVGAFVLFPLAALVGESWRRYHAIWRHARPNTTTAD